MPPSSTSLTQEVSLPSKMPSPSYWMSPVRTSNAAQDVNQPVPITYRRDDHTEETLSPSTEMGWKMMLRSFSSMHTMAHKSSKELPSFQEESQLPQLYIFE